MKDFHIFQTHAKVELLYLKLSLSTLIKTNISPNHKLFLSLRFTNQHCSISKDHIE